MTSRDIYRKLVQYGDEEKAIQIAAQCYRKCIESGKEKPSEMWPACRVDKLIKEIQTKAGKIKNNIPRSM